MLNFQSVLYINVNRHAVSERVVVLTSVEKVVVLIIILSPWFYSISFTVFLCTGIHNDVTVIQVPNEFPALTYPEVLCCNQKSPLYPWPVQSSSKTSQPTSA